MNRDTLLCVLAYAHAVVYAILAVHGCGWWGVPCLVMSLLALWEMRAGHIREVSLCEKGYTSTSVHVASSSGSTQTPTTGT